MVRWAPGHAGWLGVLSFPVQIGVNAIAIEVDGPGDGPRVISRSSLAVYLYGAESLGGEQHD